MATYTVKSGDSLSKIARDVLGDLNRWPEIAAANGIRAPYVIRVGQALRLPSDGQALVPVTLPPARPPGVTSPAAPSLFASVLNPHGPWFWVGAAGVVALWWWAIDQD